MERENAPNAYKCIPRISRLSPLCSELGLEYYIPEVREQNEETIQMTSMQKNISIRIKIYISQLTQLLFHNISNKICLFE